MESKFQDLINKVIYKGYEISISIRNDKGVICTLEDDYAINFLQVCNEDKIKNIFEEPLAFRILLTIFV